ncbi:MAG: peptidase M16 [Micavibrio sp.]|nr:peptidase M16 [Micavibrio sp.]|tara:strand:+ start:849 stop:2111 length:1263 start_codon:yes stop_codon:yes gene_type:complete
MTQEPAFKTLPNGLRIAVDPMPHVESAIIGFWCDCGARYETPENNGIAHFYEHMLFKGTAKRSASDIAEAMENIGGQMNAFTGKDVTAYYTHILKDDLETGFEILADMLLNSTFPENEFETERGVILQEIAMTEDTPDDMVFEHATARAFYNQSLGRPILGTKDSVTLMQRQQLVDYNKNHMHPANIVISASGNVTLDQVTALAERFFGNQAQGTKHHPDKAQYSGGDTLVHKDVEQAQIVLTFEGLPRGHKDAYAMKVFSTYFGAGMSSRLFQEIREKRGLVYTVSSLTQSYQDTGLFGVYMGTDASKVDESLAVYCDELLKAIESSTEEELKRAKAQMRASMLFGQESLFRRADSQGRRMLYFNELPNPKETLEKIMAVSLEDIQRVMSDIIQTPLNRCVLGRDVRVEDFEKTKKRLA